MNPLLYVDSYKVHHQKMYPEGMTKLYSNFTPRKSRIAGIDKVVVFGIQHFVLEYLIKRFNEDFFGYLIEPLNDVDIKYQKEIIRNKAYRRQIISQYEKHCNVDTKHIEELWDLGYLPIEIKALEEGTLCPIGVPMMTITNTHPSFGWLVNYLETLISCMLWQPITSATISYEYKKILNKYALETTGSTEGVQWQGHDFSMRGMSSVESAILSGMGHLTSFTGTDTIPAIYSLESSYNATGLIGASVPATEHSVMCMGTKESEIETFKRLLDLYPTGILSVVSDTWNLWKVCTQYLPELKKEILARDGKLVIRPDSGDPVDIICGYTVRECKDMSDVRYGDIDDYNAVKLNGIYYVLETEVSYEDCYGELGRELTIPEVKGVIELLWDTFGGTINEQGYKVLDSHIGAIYGDSITLDRAKQICERLKAKGFASTNIVLGIGSYTYQYNTRDTFGFAMKATYGEVKRDCICKKYRPGTDTPEDQQIPWGSCQWDDGKLFCSDVGRCDNNDFIEAREIYKDPITDDGTKRSKKGLLHVGQSKVGDIVCIDQCNYDLEQSGLLTTVFIDGKLTKTVTLTEIRERLNN